MDRVWRFTGIVWVTACALVPLSLGLLAYQAYVPLPFRELWYEVLAFQNVASGNPQLHELLRLNNEHVVLLARAVFAADFWLAHGRNLLTLPATFLLQCGTCGVLVREVLRARELPRALRVGLMGTFFVLLFARQQIENFTSPFQLHFIMSFTAAAAALALYADHQEQLARQRHSRRWFALSLCAAVFATFSLGNGLLTWLLLGVLAATGPRRPRDLPLLAAVGSAAIILYAVMALTQHKVEVSDVISAPLLSMLKLIVFLGSPFLAVSDSLAAVMGFVGIALGVGLGIAGVRRLKDWPRFARVHCMIAGYAFAAAVASVASGGGGNVGDAGQSRYTTPALFFWASGLSVLAFAASRAPRRAVAYGALTAFGGLLVGSVAWGHAAVGPQVRDTARLKRRGGLALVHGIPARRARALFYYEGPLWHATEFLRAYRLAIFTEPWTRALDTPLNDHYRVEERAHVDGAFQGILPVYGSGVRRPYPHESVRILGAGWDAVRRLHPHEGVRVVGWAWDAEEGAAPDRLVLADHTQVIRGFAQSDGLPTDAEPWLLRTPWARAWFDYPIGDNAGVIHGLHGTTGPPTHAEAPLRLRPPWRRTWFGYARAEDDMVVRAYAVTGPERVTPLPGLHFVGELSALPSALPASAWRADARWGRQPTLPDVPPTPPGYTFYSAPSDTAHAGRLVSEPFSVHAAYLIIPYRTGVDAAGVSLRLLTNDGLREIGRCPFPPRGPAWALWTVDVRAYRGQPVRLECVVAASTPADTLAIAEPRVFAAHLK